MTTLPFDIYHHIVSHASLGAINSLARSCSVIAQQVRERAHTLASIQLVRMSTGDRLACRLPNGVLHGFRRVTNETGAFVIDFALGQATTWYLDDVEKGTVWGHNDVNYTLQCGNHDNSGHGYRFQLTFLGGSRLTVYPYGLIRYTSRDTAPGQKMWRGPSIRGYLVDGKLMIGIVDPWLNGILANVPEGVKFPTVITYPVIATGEAYDIVKRVKSLNVSRA